MRVVGNNVLVGGRGLSDRIREAGSDIVQTTHVPPSHCYNLSHIGGEPKSQRIYVCLLFIFRFTLPSGCEGCGAAKEVRQI